MQLQAEPYRPACNYIVLKCIKNVLSKYKLQSENLVFPRVSAFTM